MSGKDTFLRSIDSGKDIESAATRAGNDVGACPTSAELARCLSSFLHMFLPHDPYLLDTCSDVVIRFVAHDQYGHKQKALKALRRRAPGFSPEECLAAFDMLCSVYNRAVQAIQRHPAVRPDKKSRYAEPEDIDFDECMRELDEIAPGEALNQKGQILNWVIFWHYLK